ncbi:MAG: hypothetical protein WBD40_04475 [Tepidisphaeraceae bacterium]
MTVKQRHNHRWRLTCAAVLAAASSATLPAIASALTAATARPAADILPVNPAAEIGPGAVGWTGTQGYTITPYGAPGEYPSPAVSASIGNGIVAGGGAFFDPGSEPNARLSQDIDLARFQSKIATGELNELFFTAWLGGYGGSPDTVDLQVAPLDVTGQPLANPTRLAGPTAAERDNTTAILQRIGTAPLPSATTAVRVELIATGQPGQKNHGYADEVILIPSSKAGPPRNAFGNHGDRDPAPVVRFATRTPTVFRRDGRLRLNPGATISCPRTRYACRTELVARINRSNKSIAHKTITIKHGLSAAPILTLTSAARTALLDGQRLRTTITVSSELIPDLISSARAQRTTVLRLPTMRR